MRMVSTMQLQIVLQAQAISKRYAQLLYCLKSLRLHLNPTFPLTQFLLIIGLKLQWKTQESKISVQELMGAMYLKPIPG